MSAPPTMPAMVSRLPRFGFRPKPAAPSGATQTGPVAAAGAATRLTNGFYHHPGPAGVHGGLTAAPAAAKQNGFPRGPAAISARWREAPPDERRRGNAGQNRPGTDAQRHPSPGSRTLPAPKGSGGSGPSRTPNGTAGTASGAGTAGSPKRPRGFVGSAGSGPGSGPGSRSGSPRQKNPPAGRCRSSDGVEPAPLARLAQSDRVRSRSLTQVRRLPSPPAARPSPPAARPSPPAPRPSPPSSRLPPNTRSYALGRAPSLLAPPTGRPAKPPEGGGGARVQSFPHSALKKPLLSSLGPAFKPSGISYRLSRPALIKPRPFRATANEDGGGREAKRGPRTSVDTPPTAESSPERPPEAPPPQLSVAGGSLEDMSLSSSVSSQEFTDDLDALGKERRLSGGAGSLGGDSGLDQSRARSDEDEAAVVGGGGALCFPGDGVDWAAAAGGPGGGATRGGATRGGAGQVDHGEQGASSPDLSPSDSCGSGGTYMWDEEGLAPLGGANAIGSAANATRHGGSFDSDLNSIDVLDDLDSCDLDDDDLMMDEELPEDDSLQAGGGGLAHMVEWRRRQLCWGTQDGDSDGDFQGYKLTEDSGNQRTDGTGDTDLILDLCPPRSPSPGLGLDVEELAEDCCDVRSQLERLQSVLLQARGEEDVDEDTLTTDTLSPETCDSSHNTQVQDLLQEVQQLREDLRSRDRTIAHLTLQLAVPTAPTECRCQETTGTTDRHTQTSLKERESTSQISNASSQDDQEPLTIQDPPPADPCSASFRPQIPASGFLQRPDDHVTEGAKGAREEEGERKERRRIPPRSLQPPQPSRLRLFPSQTSSPPAASRLLPRDPESSEVEVKMAAFTAGLSRLPKPKSH